LIAFSGRRAAFFFAIVISPCAGIVLACGVLHNGSQRTNERLRISGAKCVVWRAPPQARKAGRQLLSRFCNQVVRCRAAVFCARH
jgi:hypothetical protein